MKYVAKKEETNPIQEPASVFYEYKLPATRVCIGVSEINGRYPETGYEVDEKVEGCWYVEQGTGVIWIGGNEYNIEPGDVILVPANDKFYIRGERLRLIVSSSPLWYPEQHKHID